MIHDGLEDKHELHRIEVQPLRKTNGTHEAPVPRSGSKDGGGISTSTAKQEQKSTGSIIGSLQEHMQLVGFVQELGEDNKDQNDPYDDWIRASEGTTGGPLSGISGDRGPDRGIRYKQDGKGDLLSDLAIASNDPSSDIENEDESDVGKDMLDSVETLRKEVQDVRQRTSSTIEGPAPTLFREAVTAEDVRAKIASQEPQGGNRIPKSVWGGSITSHGTMGSVRSRQRRMKLNILAEATAETPGIAVIDPYSSEDDSDVPDDEEVPASHQVISESLDGFHIGGRVIPWRDPSNPKRLNRPTTVDVTVYRDELLLDSRGSQRFGTPKSHGLSRSRIPNRRCPTCNDVWDSVVYNFDEHGIPQGECVACVQSRYSDTSAHSGRSNLESKGITKSSETERQSDQEDHLRLPGSGYTAMRETEGNQQKMKELKEQGISIDELNERYRADTTVCVYRDCQDIASSRVGDKTVNPGLCGSHQQRYDFKVDRGHITLSFVDLLDGMDSHEKKVEHITKYRCLTQTPTGICFQPKRRNDPNCDYCYMSSELSTAGMGEPCGFTDKYEIRSRKRGSSSGARSRSRGEWSGGEPSSGNNQLRPCEGEANGWLSSRRWDDDGSTPWCDTHQRLIVDQLSTKRTCSNCNKPNWLPSSWKPLSREFYQMTNNTCASCFPQTSLAKANPNFAEAYERFRQEAEKSNIANDTDIWREKSTMNEARADLYDKAPWMWVLNEGTRARIEEDWDRCYNPDSD